MSMRRTAEVVGCTYKTVERRFSYFAKISKTHHEELIKNISPVTDALLDDMESNIHTKLKQVSIPMVVEKSTRLILSFDVVSMPAKGMLAELSRKKYGPRPDDRKKGWETVLTILNKMAAPGIEILSDEHKMYPSQIKKHVPGAVHKTVKSRRACVAGQGELKTGGFDPMFAFNHTAAMLRANINRLIRRTWCTSKKIEHLYFHIAIYVLWHNGHILAKMADQRYVSPFAGLC